MNCSLLFLVDSFDLLIGLSLICCSIVGFVTQFSIDSLPKLFIHCSVYVGFVAQFVGSLLNWMIHCCFWLMRLIRCSVYCWFISQLVDSLLNVWLISCSPGGFLAQLVDSLLLLIDSFDLLSSFCLIRYQLVDPLIRLCWIRCLCIRCLTCGFVTVSSFLCWFVCWFIVDSLHNLWKRCSIYDGSVAQLVDSLVNVWIRLCFRLIRLIRL